MKVLMVCLGNICRSPLAEGILQHKAKQAGLKWLVDSAGTSNYHIGDQPHQLSQKVAMINGIDISRQKARQFSKDDMVKFDKIYVMDSQNYQDVKVISREFWNEDRVKLLLNESHPGSNMNVPDPWFGTEDGYHKVYQLISDACEAIVHKTIQHKTTK
ncbi:MAG TPA: low molecular weight protein-tyrosine-phosphatase [Panacibacter sp.]|nr:low molecular weight protein-tyrosine-phosphatase [Panacibacter sp.]HNP45868.1 low molecular weight protein-tyrosine-phosphatase [Panacibacter sp.]